MPGKLYLILTTLTTILVLLSFWGIPILLFWCAYDWITILWGRIVLIILGALWIILIRPFHPTQSVFINTLTYLVPFFLITEDFIYILYKINTFIIS